MIVGVFEKRRDYQPLAEHIQRMFAEVCPPTDVKIDLCGSAAFGTLTPVSHTESHITPEATNRRRGYDVAWKGEIYNRIELLQALGSHTGQARDLNDQEIFLRLYETYGRSCVEKINGHFAFAVYDHQHEEIVLGRDRLGIETLYYYEDPKITVFSTRVAPILAHPGVPKELNLDALRRFLVFNYNPAWDTFFRGIKKVRPGYLISLGQKDASATRYWFLSFRHVQDKREAEFCDDLRVLMKDAVRLRTQGMESLGMFLSGGMDSSSVAGLAHECVGWPFTTFSYRCLSRSFDESVYARIMAKHCGSEHHEVIYDPADICQIESMVRLMDEPFCDVGINIATFLLGQTAQGKVSRVCSGDGGDELFGGHPVYTADKIAAVFESIPHILRRPVTALCRHFPDSDQKKNFTVKLKRFSESLGYPRELGTHRWRLYYGDDELRALLLPDMWAYEKHAASTFADVVELMHEADGPDVLSRSLYVDFQTVLGFSLRRMDLLHHFQIRPCFPLLDHRLVEYTATIPSRLKIRGLSDTKYIQHRAMEGLLPDEIVHRHDKLGHSIPFKNWLRDEPVVKQFVLDVLSGQRLKDRGLNSEYVHTLWNNHQNNRQNNSHRLWGLTVLELWMSARNL